MLVRELIEMLLTHDPNLKVVVPGTEDSMRSALQPVDTSVEVKSIVIGPDGLRARSTDKDHETVILIR